MKKHRWQLLALLLTIVLAAMAAGCGGDDGDDEAGGTAADTAAETGGEQVSGNVSVMAVWTGPEQASFRAVLDGFEEANPDVTVNYTSAGDQLPTQLSTAVEGGNPPDVAVLPQPGLMRDFAEKDALQPLDFMQEDVEANLGESAVELGSVEGTLYGFLFKAANKSTVWYNAAAFEEAEIEEPPATWDEFLEAADTVNQSGLPAFSIGGADGWTLTDLFENIYLRSAGPELYDQLSRHEIPWTHESVKEALAEMAKVVGDNENIVGGAQGALQTDFPTSVTNVLSQEPKAAMVIEGDFVPGAVDHGLEPETDFNVFEFPTIGDSENYVVGGGDTAVMFTDTPAAQALMRYMASAEAAQIWAERGGFASLAKDLDTGVYPDAITQTTAGALSEAEVFRFDLSDLQPAAFGGTVGQGLFKLFQDFVKNPDDVDGITQQMEEAAAAAFG